MGLDMFLFKKSKNENADKVAYWHEANAIHKWFVDNIQRGVDDCGMYEVSKHGVSQLLLVCEIIKMTCIKPYNGTYRVVNQKTAKEFLPTYEGHFFGSTEYDATYAKNVIQTVSMLEEIIDTFDFENNTLCYVAWW